MRLSYMLGTLAAVPALLLCGCATTPSLSTTGSNSQMRNTVYATHQVVRKLDKRLDDSINKLRDTTAGLDARMAAMDVQSRSLLSTAEENQLKLEALQQRLDELAQVVYKHFGVTPPSRHFNVAPVAPLEDLTVSMVTPGATGTVTARPPEPVTPKLDARPKPANTAAATGGGAATDYGDARAFYVDGDYAGAITQFTLYVEKYPESQYASYAQFWKAQCYIKLKDYATAIAQFDALRTTYPKSKKIPTAMNQQAIAYDNVGQRARAIALLRQLIQDYPMEPASEDARGNLKILEGQQ